MVWQRLKVAVLNHNKKPLERLKTLEGYRRYFMDANFWQPYVHLVCQRHGLTPCQAVRAGLAGTCPAFIVEDRWVVKFFGELFEGGAAFETERQIGELLAAEKQIPAPAIIAAGELLAGPADWPWPYLIFEFIPGVSIGEVYEQVSLADKLRLAQMMGEITQRLHRLPLPEHGLLQPSWAAYTNLLQAQYARCKERQRREKSLPDRLIEQIEDFLLPLEGLIDQNGKPYLIHADLTADHVLGRLEGGRWTTLGLIDFGDAMAADWGYELIALHLDLFRCNKRLLAAYLAAYGLSEGARRGLPAKAMSLTLLHRFNVLEGVFGRYPKADAVSTLGELATLLWEVNAPGVDD